MEKKELQDGSLQNPGRRKTFKIMAGAAAALLTGCGGGGSSSNVNNNDNEVTPPENINNPVNGGIEILGVSYDEIRFRLQARDEDGIENIVVYCLEVLDNQGSRKEIDNQVIPLNGEYNAFDQNLKFVGLNPGTNYELRAVINGINGTNSELEPIVVRTYGETDEVPNQTPTISLTASATSIIEGESVTLTANASDPDGSIESITWKVDGQALTDENGNYEIVLVDLGVGTHKVEVEVTDDDGAKSIAEQTITVNGISNQVPTVSVSASATSITEGESVTLTANASDPDGSIASIVWYDSNGNQIGTGDSITITPNSTGTFYYYAIATDNDGASKQSNTITINVEEITYNASWQTPLQSEVNNTGLEPGVISDASGQQVVINDLVDYTSNLPDGSTFQIVSSVTNGGDETRMTGFSIEGNSLIRDGPNTGGSRTYGTLTIQIIYPDGTTGPNTTLDVEIANT